MASSFRSQQYRLSFSTPSEVLLDILNRLPSGAAWPPDMLVLSGEIYKPTPEECLPGVFKLRPPPLRTGRTALSFNLTNCPLFPSLSTLRLLEAGRDAKLTKDLGVSMALSSQTSSAGASNSGTQQLEPSLRHFADPSFDPVDFINNSLPPLTLSASQPHASRAPGSVPLAELSSRSQSLVSQIGTQNVRLSGILTQLTEEILRSGGRLAYEVEVLRGESISLADALAETLREDIIKFVPQAQNDGELEDEPKGGDVETEREKVDSVARLPEEPEYIAQLRILAQVRTRLEEVIQIFGDAMEWPLPPSELSITSSFISVSAPEPGTESHSREERGQEVAKTLRTEITELLDSNGGGDAGLAAATRRLEGLRNLGTVWKGTAEEKARTRFLDSLAKIIEDRRRALENQRDRASRKGRSSMDQIAEERSNADSGPGGGLFRNLQRIRDEIYLE